MRLRIIFACALAAVAAFCAVWYAPALLDTSDTTQEPERGAKRSGAPRREGDTQVTIDSFVKLYNANAITPLEDLEVVDVRDKTGEYYRDLYEFPTFYNSTANVAQLDGGQMEIISYGYHKKDGLRIYATCDTKELRREVFVNALTVFDGTLTESEIIGTLEEMETSNTGSAFVVGATRCTCTGSDGAYALMIEDSKFRKNQKYIDTVEVVDLSAIMAMPMPSPTPSPEPTPWVYVEEEMAYVLNNNTMKFHVPSCDSVRDIYPENRSDVVATRSSLTAQGYDPCQNCFP